MKFCKIPKISSQFDNDCTSNTEAAAAHIFSCWVSSISSDDDGTCFAQSVWGGGGALHAGVVGGRREEWSKLIEYRVETRKCGREPRDSIEPGHIAMSWYGWPDPGL